MTSETVERIQDEMRCAINHRFGERNTDDYGDYLMVFYLDDDLVREAIRNTRPNGRISQVDIDTAGTDEVALKVELDTDGNEVAINVTAVDVDGTGYLESHEITPVIQYLIDDAEQVVRNAVRKIQMQEFLSDRFGHSMVHGHESDAAKFKATVHCIEDSILKEIVPDGWSIRGNSQDQYISFGDGYRDVALDIMIDLDSKQGPTVLIDPMDRDSYPIPADQIPMWFAPLRKKIEEEMAEVLGVPRLRHEPIVKETMEEGVHVLIDIPDSELDPETSTYTTIDFEDRAGIDPTDMFKVHVKFDRGGEVAWNRQGRKSEGRGVIRESEQHTMNRFTHANRKDIRNEMSLDFFSSNREVIEAAVIKAAEEGRITDHPKRQKGKRILGVTPMPNPRKLARPTDRRDRSSRALKM